MFVWQLFLIPNNKIQSSTQAILIIRYKRLSDPWEGIKKIITKIGSLIKTSSYKAEAKFQLLYNHKGLTNRMKEKNFKSDQYF